jgi:hypothetical protein
MDSLQYVVNWIEAARNRFEQMALAGVDTEGIENVKRMYDHIKRTQHITVGQAQYIFDRTHRLGRYPRYNTFRRYNKRYGDLIRCDLTHLVMSDVVDWSTGHSCIQANFKLALRTETGYEYHNGKLRRIPENTFTTLFR